MTSSGSQMRWGSALVEGGALGDMIDRAAADVREQLGGSADITFAFLSSGFELGHTSVPWMLHQRLGHQALLGCSAGGVIGARQEIEGRRALSLVAARLPGVTVRTFHLEQEALPDLDASPRAWHDLLQIQPAEEPQFVVLADPFTFNADRLLPGLDFAYPNAAKIGGLASGADSRERRPNSLFADDAVYDSGAVGVTLTGDLRLDTIVAQGCRPIGRPAAITAADGNLILALDGHPPLEHLQAVLERLPEEDRELARHSLFLGIAMTPFLEKPGQGDFLIRNLMDIDPQTGSIVVGARVREGQTVQFHLRDARTSADDLESMLGRYAAGGPADARGALLFSCVGRGQFLYGRSHHDSEMFHARIGSIPLGGFFCNGEIGAVGGTTFLHGYTSCFGIFRPKSSPIDVTPPAALRERA